MYRQYFNWYETKIKSLSTSQSNIELNIDLLTKLQNNQFNLDLVSPEITESNSIFLSFPCHLEADNLIVPSFPGTIAWMPKWSCLYLKNLFLKPNSDRITGKKRLYLSRNQSGNRRLINEVEVINFLQKYDFEVVNLELLTIAQQAQILSQAQIVISPHGSGLSNIVFCQVKTIIIEIFSPHYVYPCYWLISNLMNLDYYYLMGEVIGSCAFHQLLYPDSRFEDLYLNLKKLESMLNSMLIF